MTKTDNWPMSGEIDIIEGVNEQRTNQISVHTSAGCGLNGDDPDVLGHWTGLDSNSTSGFAFVDQNTKSYGGPFNVGKGGVYAMEWTSHAISVWFWPRAGIPADVIRHAPDPSTWGKPSARFQGTCDLDQHFKDQNIVILSRRWFPDEADMR